MEESTWYKNGGTKVFLAVITLFVVLAFVGTLPSFAFADTAETPAELIYEAPDPGENPHPDSSLDPAEPEKGSGKAPIAKTGDEGTTLLVLLLLSGTALACFSTVYASTKTRKEDQ